MLCLSPFPKLIKLEIFIICFQHLVTLVDMLVFDRNMVFALPLTCNDLDKCCTYDDRTRGMNGYKGIMKAITLFSTYVKSFSSEEKRRK